MASPNGGIIGPINKSSRGLNGQTIFTASNSKYRTAPGTKSTQYVVVAEEVVLEELFHVFQVEVEVEQAD